MPPQLDLPVLQNWSCHNCGGCCRQHAIYITPEEQSRIVGQGWNEQSGIPAGRPLFIEENSWTGGKKVRLAHQADGGCVFLDERGLCRIHARFGEAAKPLACRIYPYAFHPAGKRLAVSLRFSCPSVAKNQGAGVATQRQELGELAAAVAPANYQSARPPRLTENQQLDWADTTRIVAALERTLAPADQPVALKLLRALFWINLIEQASFEKIRGGRIDELLDILTHEATFEIPELPADPPRPSKLGLAQFRLLAGQYARKDTQLSLEGGWRTRWQNLRSGLLLARGRGTLPAAQPGLKPVPLAVLDRPAPPLSAESEELFTRYFLVKVHSWSFCGAAFYDVPLVEGFRSLALVLPAAKWLSRWVAYSDDRDEVTHDDLVRAINIIDHQHGYSPAFGTAPFRSRVRTLQAMGDLDKLVASR